MRNARRAGESGNTAAAVLVLSMLACADAAPASAQSATRSRKLGVSAGVAVEAEARQEAYARLGAVVAGLAVWRTNPRFGLRTQAQLARFPKAWPPSVATPCPPSEDPSQCAGRSRVRGALTFVGASAGVALFDDEAVRTGRGAYYFAGGTVYRPLEDPERVYLTRAGWNLGIGSDIRLGDHDGVFEVKYERVAHWVHGYWAMVPITIGFLW